jgi:hypothetical protein
VIRLLAHAKWAVAVVCAYEVAAITTDAVPTVSAICRRKRWATPVVLGGLAVHLLHRPKEWPL